MVATLAIAGCRTNEISTSTGPFVANSGSGTWINEGIGDFRLELEQVFGTEANSNETLTASRHAAVDAAGNVYVYDFRSYNIVSYGPTGEFRWRAGGKGKGPGEFEGAAGIVTDERGIWIGNAAGRVDHFDYDGNYVRSISLARHQLILPTPICVLDNGTILLQSALFGTWNTNLSYLDTRTDSVIHSVEVAIDGPRSIQPGTFMIPPTIACDGAEVSIPIPESYRTTFVDSTGTIVRSFSREDVKLTAQGHAQSGEGSGRTETFSGLSAPVVVNNQYRLVTAYWASNLDDPDEYVKRKMNGLENQEIETEHTVDLFSLEGELLATHHGSGTPEIGEILTVDANGRIYTSLDEHEEPQIRRYRLVIDNKNN